MVFRGRLDGVEAAASLKDTSVSLAVGTGYVVAWDLGGRLYSVFENGHTFRRGLGGRVLHKWRDERVPEAAGPYDQRCRVTLTGSESDALLDGSAALADRARRAIEGNPSAWRSTSGATAGAPLAAALARCARFDSAAGCRDAARFAQVYAGIGILPPDQYLSVILQATTGCSFGSCTFCDLYHDGYRVRTVEEFARHAAEVREHLGASLLLRRRSIFLGAANALAVPMARLTGIFRVARDAFGPPPPPVHAFVDAFTGSMKDARDYGRLRELGLARVYIGLESGHDPLLAFVKKPGRSAQAVETVRAVHAAGIPVGVIVMVGLGGHHFWHGHVADTIATLKKMELGAGDLLYFSDLVEQPGTAYPIVAGQEGIRPLALGDRISQLREIVLGLTFAGAPPKLARYDIREFVY